VARKPTRYATKRGQQQDQSILYVRCDNCGNKVDIAMVKALGRGHACVLCINLAVERKQRDALNTEDKR
jgi:hypothetical protein